MAEGEVATRMSLPPLLHDIPCRVMIDRVTLVQRVDSSLEAEGVQVWDSITGTTVNFVRDRSGCAHLGLQATILSRESSV